MNQAPTRVKKEIYNNLLKFCKSDPNDIFSLIFFKNVIILVEKFEGKFETWRNGNETENIPYGIYIHSNQSRLCGQRTVHPC